MSAFAAPADRNPKAMAAAAATLPIRAPRRRPDVCFLLNWYPPYSGVCGARPRGGRGGTVERADLRAAKIDCGV